MDILLSSSPAPYSPSTPLSNRTKSLSRNNHKPLNSSPLAYDHSSPFSSPVAEAQARRQSQYKSRVPSGPQRQPPLFAPNPRSVSRIAGSSSAGGKKSQETILRDRFKQRCLQRAEKVRAKVHASKRKLDSGGDACFEDMDDDMDGSDDDMMQDELYRRIMLNQVHQQRHAYLRSYYAEVGSSFDPDLEDVAAWEDELHANRSTQPSSPVIQQNMQDGVEMTPEELEQAELEAYAAECERQAALADFEDIPFDELFNEELEELTAEQGKENQIGDIDMDAQ